MQDRKQILKKIFFAVSVLATVFVLTEIVMQSFGKSICQTEGCKVVAQFVRYGDISILLIGLVTFSFLAITSFLEVYRNKTSFGPLINVVLIVSLACEGFFTGYQVFIVHTPCLFCLIVFAFIGVLGVIRLLAGEREVIAGLLSLAAVFSMFYLVLPVKESVILPDNERVILFYSEECSHCAEVIKHLDEKKIEVKHLDVKEYSLFLKSMGIDTVPTIMVKGQNQRLFLSGKDAILNYLCRCSPSGDSCEDIAKGKSSDPATPTVLPSRGTGTAIDIFNQPSLLTGPMSSDEGGMCKQDEICK